MAESREGGRTGGPPSDAPGTRRAAAGRRPALLVAVAGAVLVFCWAFPPFHIVSLNAAATANIKADAVSGKIVFDAGDTAARIWNTDLRAAAARAVDLKSFAAQLRQDPAGAKKKYAKSSGLGTAYYFVRGRGKVIARDGNYVRVALDGSESTVVALRIGPVFGNTVRDGSGLLDVNSFPGLQEFNAISAELNTLVEKNVLPTLREKAVVGASVLFAGCAEAPETVGAPNEPLLLLVPVEAEVR